MDEPQEVDNGTLPQLNSSRGVEDHRADPALRQALDHLDALRSSQPTMDDFAFENYYSGGRPRPDRSSCDGPPARRGAGGAARPNAAAHRAAGGERSAGERFSLDLLMAAAGGDSATEQGQFAIEHGYLDGALPMPSSGVGYPLHIGPLSDTSRSTTPGDGRVSSFSVSVASTSSTASPPAEKVAPRPPRCPVLPSAPRRPGGRPRADSARSRRRVQAAVESAAADLAAYAAPHSAR